MAKYNTTNDIPYLKFMRYASEIEGKSNDMEFVAEKVIEYFYPEVKDNYALYVEEFGNALKKTKPSFIKYRLALKKLNKAGFFIDADSFRNDKDYESLLNLICKPLFPFYRLDAEKINLADGLKIMQSFLKELPRLSNPFNIFLIRQLRLQMQR
jgi:hypothetical protein